MSIAYGGLERLKIKYPHLDPSQLKIIGWGAGQWFRDYYPHLRIPIEYTICPTEENQGKNIHGIEVRSPQQLNHEDPAKTLIIIIASHSNKITNQILKLGNYYCIPALKFGIDDVALLSELQNLINLKTTLKSAPNHNPEIGFFYQGPINPYTELGLKYQRIKFPTDYHCLVTYTNQNQEIINQCRDLVDEVIQIDDPVNPGHSNRNRMIRTSKIGAHAIHAKNCKYTVRVRSGNIVVGDVRKFIFNAYRDRTLNNNKIGFNMSWSWKNIPFHISDTFLIARSFDMIKLWSIPEDDRQMDSLEFSKVNTGSHFSELFNITNEAYLWTKYAETLGYESFDLHDYYRFMIENLIPLDPDLITFSLKHTHLVNIDYDNSYAPDINWWKSLTSNFQLEYQRGLSRYTSDNTVQNFWGAKVG